LSLHLAFVVNFASGGGNLPKKKICIMMFPTCIFSKEEDTHFFFPAKLTSRRMFKKSFKKSKNNKFAINGVFVFSK
jgi:hypothetical protein